MFFVKIQGYYDSDHYCIIYRLKIKISKHVADFDEVLDNYYLLQDSRIAISIEDAVCKGSHFLILLFWREWVYNLSEDWIKLSMNETSCGQITVNTDGTYDIIRWLRVSIIFISSSCLLANVIMIIKRKQYKFNTIRLFMFVEIFYFLSLISVTPHGPSFNLGYDQLPKDKINSMQTFMNCMIEKSIEYRCAIEAFVNLVCYALSYWFAVCITIYIRHVLDDTHRQFLKKKGSFIFGIITIIIVWYMVPFVLTFIKDMPFSFGPTGYGLDGKSYFLYAGIVNRTSVQSQEETVGNCLVITWMALLPLLMFCYHAVILFQNGKSIRKLTELDQINPRQFFLIKSGRLSFIIFLVQMINSFKLVLALTLSEDQSATEIILFIINTLYDLLALVLIYIYFHNYFREGITLQQSPIMSSSLVDSSII